MVTVGGMYYQLIRNQKKYKVLMGKVDSGGERKWILNIESTFDVSFSSRFKFRI